MAEEDILMEIEALKSIYMDDFSGILSFYSLYLYICLDFNDIRVISLLISIYRT